MNQTKQETATRATLTEDWQEMQKRVDWMAAPNMAEYVNGLVSGKSLADGGHWAAYARDQHVLPLLNARKQDDPTVETLSMMSLACGSGHIEYSLLKQFGWPIGDFLGLEYDEQLRIAAQQSFQEFPTCRREFRFFDFNADNKPTEKFDIIFTCHSIHHATDLERMLPFINASLKPGGLFIGIDYFGPTRFQIEYDVLPIIEELFAILPSNMRRNLIKPDGPVEDTFRPATIQEIRTADPSESIRSSDLRTLLFSNFKVVEIKPMGGTLLRWLLQYRAGNFNPNVEEHVAIARLLQVIEREFIALRRIKSDDLFFVLQGSERLAPPAAIPAQLDNVTALLHRRTSADRWNGFRNRVKKIFGK